jgi:hypothetical protein
LVGASVGGFVGTFVGASVGGFVGTLVGASVGGFVGTLVGTLVGASDLDDLEDLLSVLLLLLLLTVGLDGDVVGTGKAGRFFLRLLRRFLLLRFLTTTLLATESPSFERKVFVASSSCSLWIL